MAVFAASVTDGSVLSKRVSVVASDFTFDVTLPTLLSLPSKSELRAAGKELIRGHWIALCAEAAYETKQQISQSQPASFLTRARSRPVVEEESTV